MVFWKEEKGPTSYQEWTLAGKPGTYEEWIRYQAPKVEKPKNEQDEIDKFYAEADALGKLLDSGNIKWADAWQRLRIKYPKASIELIDQTLSYERRRKSEAGE